MIITLDGKALLDGLKTVAPAVSKRAVLPALGSFRLEVTAAGLTITGTDLETVITTTVPSIGTMPNGAIPALEAGAILAPVDILKIVDGKNPVTLETDSGAAATVGGILRVTTAGRSVTLRAPALEDYPDLSAPGVPAIAVPAATFAERFGRMYLTASADEARPVLTGVLLEVDAGILEMTSTDSYRLGHDSVDAEAGASMAPAKVIVPSRLAKIIGKQQKRAPGYCDVSFEDSRVSFTFGATSYTTRKIEGEFPNWKQLVPADSPNVLEPNTDDMARAIKNLAPFTTPAKKGDGSAPVRVIMSYDSLELKAGAQDIGEGSETVPATYRGEPLTVGFNADYLLDGLAFLATDHVSIGTRDGLKPAMFTNGREGVFYLLMPVRL